MKKVFVISVILSLGILNITLGQTKKDKDNFETQREKLFEERDEPTGNDAEGLVIPNEMSKTDTSKQDAKLKEMLKLGFIKPLDYGDLAVRILNNEFILLPLITDSYILHLDWGVSSDEFIDYDKLGKKTKLQKNSPKNAALSKLVDNYYFGKFDLETPLGRKQLRLYLLRSANPKVKPVLDQIGTAFKNKFNRLLKITSAGRSIEYQNTLKVTNSNSTPFPSHLSGCAIDIGITNMTAEEQNFLMTKLAEMENRGILDALRDEDNTVFHIFVYPY